MPAEPKTPPGQRHSDCDSKKRKPHPFILDSRFEKSIAILYAHGVDTQDISPVKKALKINLDPRVYGTFAEIGAGQDVARYFFIAGKASQTVAKTMSAYDMVFSDAIYGKSGRYVSQERLNRMLEHEYELLVERLQEIRGDKTCFFAFADTVATHQDVARCHGWMGLKFQLEPLAPPVQVRLHVRLHDRYRLQQTEALGILGVNLIEACFYHNQSIDDFLTALTDHLHAKRIEIDMIEMSGDGLSHIDNRLLSLELVRRGLTDAILFGPKGQMLQPSDALFKQTIFVQRGTFRPVTKTNLEILERGLNQAKRDWDVKDIKVLFEMTVHGLAADGKVDPNDFLQRVDTLSVLGHSVLVSNFFLFHGLKAYLRRYTDQPIGLVIGASHLEKLFDQKYYTELSGGILEGFSRLFDEKTRMYVFPFKSEEICLTSQTFHPGPKTRFLYEHLKANKWVMDLAGCDEVDTSMHSHAVRELLAAQDPKWEAMVPEAVSERIKAYQLFGYRTPSRKKKVGGT